MFTKIHRTQLLHYMM